MLTHDFLLDLLMVLRLAVVLGLSGTFLLRLAGSSSVKTRASPAPLAASVA